MRDPVLTSELADELHARAGRLERELVGIPSSPASAERAGEDGRRPALQRRTPAGLPVGVVVLP